MTDMVLQGNFCPVHISAEARAKKYQSTGYYVSDTCDYSSEPEFNACGRSPEKVCLPLKHCSYRWAMVSFFDGTKRRIEHEHLTEIDPFLDDTKYKDRDEYITASDGWFYIVELMPTKYKKRMKFGFTQNVSKRLAAYRTSCPECILVACYKANAREEKPAIEYITRKISCNKISSEVFDVENFDDMIQKAGLFFHCDDNTDL